MRKSHTVRKSHTIRENNTVREKSCYEGKNYTIREMSHFDKRHTIKNVSTVREKVEKMGWCRPTGVQGYLV